MHRYHLSRNGKVLGIYPEDRMKDYFAEGRVGPNDLVWREGLDSWLPAWRVFGSEASEAAPAPAPVPPQLPSATAFPSSTDAPKLQAAAVPLPPRMHWGLVLLLTLVTFGIFYVIWMFVQANWVRRLNPESNATTLMVIYLVLVIAGQAAAENNPEDSVMAVGGALLVIAGWVASFFAFFSMRRSMLEHYNQREPIGLRLSAAMTFFFNVLYFQHHMSCAVEDHGRVVAALTGGQARKKLGFSPGIST
jgi:hypothetical protein